MCVGIVYQTPILVKSNVCISLCVPHHLSIMSVQKVLRNYWTSFCLIHYYYPIVCWFIVLLLRHLQHRGCMPRRLNAHGSFCDWMFAALCHSCCSKYGLLLSRTTYMPPEDPWNTYTQPSPQSCSFHSMQVFACEQFPLTVSHKFPSE